MDVDKNSGQSFDLDLSIKYQSHVLYQIKNLTIFLKGHFLYKDVVLEKPVNHDISSLQNTVDSDQLT